ncbi:Hypothetical protein GbCGDNIH6_2158 [Granulibacter bethesdensis]|uniref:amylo-alpha-1,6-glucosidase n=1 Tax=Granulibacter bethesdensis TaxID=364410 RepID=UPI00090A145D|nr:amylo-alpha-1,6-glucosidase [Granulibacter bethesdensis]APH57989.1 Hypothetical protein GbCGDNIH6_2158 [Granulibacter bethesdensis]
MTDSPNTDPAFPPLTDLPETDPWPAHPSHESEEEGGGAKGISRQLALKHGDCFLVADQMGDMHGDDDGFFDNDTRVLSRFRLMIGDRSPSLLGAAVSYDNVYATTNMTNRPLPPLGGQSLPEGVILVERRRFLWDHCLYERITLVNFGQTPATVPIELRFAADFRDMFEVRGLQRVSRGRVMPPEINHGMMRFAYQGLDKINRVTLISFSIPPARLEPGQAAFLFHLEREGRIELFMEIGPQADASPSRERFRKAAARARWAMRAKRRRAAEIDTPSRMYRQWIDRSAADLALLTTDLPTGPYPYAGIPWFSTPFGRDAVITSLQRLWLDPGMARGVLTFLASHQATDTSSFQDSAPGKIVHEMRHGEMTTLKEIPFGQYYGGVDTTPLFVVLAGSYADRTGDMALIDTLWPALMAAIAWVEGPGDSNGDGFLDYARGEESGLANQGWKDSFDSVFGADAKFPQGPVALVEVQGYVHAAYLALASLSERRGLTEDAVRWRTKATRLRAAIEDKFWMEDLGCYGIALDGNGELCRVPASNAGHLLYTGVPSPERAARLTGLLSSPSFNSGWGIRTLGTTAPRYNPMSYHNGSVWPHDTALCVAGMASYGERDVVSHITRDMFESAVHLGMRLPELYCGFPRSPGEAPISYPVACLPQAWAAGSVFMMLQACLGLRINGWKKEITVDRPTLPYGLDVLHLKRLQLGDSFVDLTFQRVGDRVVCLPGANSRAVVSIVTR